MNPFMAMKCTPNSPMQPSTGCERVKCTAFGTKNRTKTDSELFFSDNMSSGFLFKKRLYTKKYNVQDSKKSKALFLVPKTFQFIPSRNNP